MLSSRYCVSKQIFFKWWKRTFQLSTFRHSKFSTKILVRNTTTFMKRKEIRTSAPNLLQHLSQSCLSVFARWRIELHCIYSKRLLDVLYMWFLFSFNFLIHYYSTTICGTFCCIFNIFQRSLTVFLNSTYSTFHPFTV